MIRSTNRAFSLLVCLCSPLFAQKGFYAGALGGVSTLSADARFSVNSTATSASSYKPENGAVVHVIGGTHLNDWLSLQANYIWHSNDLTVTSVRNSGFGEQDRGSDQHSVSGDVLVYFRDRRSRVRPYLSAGAGAVRFHSSLRASRASAGVPQLPAADVTSTSPVIRFAVGIDLALSRGWAFRYSFAETIGRNEISRRLSPPGERNLARFHNLFGFVKTF